MLALSSAKLTALIGYALAGSGMILYTQLDRIVDLRMGDLVLNAAALGSSAYPVRDPRRIILWHRNWPRRGSHRISLPNIDIL